MGLSWFGTVIDCQDPERLAQFWSAALGYVVVFRDEHQVAIAKDHETHPGLVFLHVDEPKQAKNRLHLDLQPQDQAVEVARMLALGASQVDIGQGDVSWAVMADPEGNEFCVLHR